MSESLSYEEQQEEIARLSAALQRADTHEARNESELSELSEQLATAQHKLKRQHRQQTPVSDARGGSGRGAKATARAQRRQARERFNHSATVERRFSRQLRAVAKQVGVIVNGLAPKGIVRAPQQLTQALHQYSAMIRPWARSVSETMLAEVAQRDEIAWASMGREIGRELRKEVRSAPTGHLMRELLTERVDLITSLPTKAAHRVHGLTIEAMSESGARAAEIAKDIQRTGHVTESRAMLIARTEVSSTASAMTEARARHVGSKGYFWRTVGDSDVRHDHSKLEGQFIPWGEPPIAGTGKGGVPVRYHAGRGPNCRCYPEPSLPDIIE